MSPGVTVAVIAKAPRPGRVKTRLCPPCTPHEAAALAEAALADTLETLITVPADRHVVALDGAPGPWLPDGFSVVAQCGGGLGDRLAHAFTTIGGPAFLVGMDTPQLDAGAVTEALEVLGQPGTDAVIGPAHDGGWWGLGLLHPDERVFRGIRMSTADTCAQQLRRLDDLGLRTRVLPTLRDVDDFGDALAVAELAPDTRFARLVRTLAREVGSPAIR
jgi:rSAM/selenodomain-associated transferase 1